jgi:hypothetical protein
MKPLGRGNESELQVAAIQALGMTSDSVNISPVGWYVATYVLRFVELSESGNDDPERKFLTWENTILVKAADLDEAYDKTVSFASKETAPYKGGPEGVDVQWLFEGVLELLPVYDEIGDGSEIMWAKRSPRKLVNIRKSARGRGQFRQ